MKNIIISGKGGSGKTQFAMEMCRISNKIKTINARNNVAKNLSGLNPDDCELLFIDECTQQDIILYETLAHLMPPVVYLTQQKITDPELIKKLNFIGT